MRVDPHRAARRRDAGRAARGHRRVQRRSRRRRVLVQVPLPAAARRRGRAARDRSRQGRRRPAPGEPRQARAWACRAPRPCTPLGIQALLVHVQGADRGPARRDHRARPHDRPAAREPALAEGAERERDRHRVPHRARTSCPTYTKRSRHHRGGRGPAVDPHARHGAARRRGRRRRARRCRAARSSPTSTRRARRSRAGSRPGSAASARRPGRCCCARPSRRPSGGPDIESDRDDRAAAGRSRRLRGVRHPGRARRAALPVVRACPGRRPRAARCSVGSGLWMLVGGAARGVRRRAADRRRGPLSSVRPALNSSGGRSGPKIRAGGSAVLLAELIVRHTRRHMPTRRVALDGAYLPTSGPAHGVALLAAVVATNLPAHRRRTARAAAAPARRRARAASRSRASRCGTACSTTCTASTGRATACSARTASSSSSSTCTARQTPQVLGAVHGRGVRCTRAGARSRSTRSRRVVDGPLGRARARRRGALRRRPTCGTVPAPAARGRRASGSRAARPRKMVWRGVGRRPALGDGGARPARRAWTSTATT